MTALAKSTAATPNIEALITLVKPDMERVNTLILNRMGSDVSLIPQITAHLVHAGGKRLRPMLTLAAAQACGYAGDHHILLATAVEFMHTATLLHDDVVDESDLRRGRPTARRLFGNQASVLVGDFLLGQAFKMMVETGSLPCLDVLSSAASIIAEGEVLQLSVAKSLATTQAQYEQVIEAKTAALFLAATHVGAIIAGQNATTCTAMAQFGRYLGLSFQIVDDVLDFSGTAASMGKNVGDDLREGKVTLPIIHAYAQATSAADKAFWQCTVERGEITDVDIPHAVQLVHSSGALAKAMHQARSYGAAALAQLESLPQNAATHALTQVVQYNLARNV